MIERDKLAEELARVFAIVTTAERAGNTGIVFNEDVEGDGPVVFAHACRLGLEGIVSKRKGSKYQSGRSPH